MERNLPNDRGQVGIGTLIVFIALVLVAAIAAGVLINTAGLLQDSAEETGGDTQSEVSDRLVVTNAFGNVNSGAVDEVQINVRPSAGASSLNVTNFNLEFIDEQNGNFGTIGLNNSNVSITSPAGGADIDVLPEDGDRANITITDAGFLDISPGDTVDLTFVSPGGGETVVSVTVPDVIEGRSAVDLLD